MTDGYNGWTNYETWVVNLWMDNEEGTQTYWSERAAGFLEDCESASDAAYELAQVLKAEYEEQVEQTGITGPLSDLLNASLSTVNWREIAEAWIANATEQAEE